MTVAVTFGLTRFVTRKGKAVGLIRIVRRGSVAARAHTIVLRRIASARIKPFPWVVLIFIDVEFLESHSDSRHQDMTISSHQDHTKCFERRRMFKDG